MNIHNNYLYTLYDLLKPRTTVLDLLGNARGNSAHIPLSARYDTLEISIQDKHKQIEAVINSGEALRGVSFEEFKQFMYASSRGRPEAELLEQYDFVCRGAKDIVQKRDFYAFNETSCSLPGLIQGVIYSDAYQEEATKLRERYANNEKLTLDEKRLMNSADNDALAEAENQRIANIMTNSFKKTLSEHGLSEDEMEGVKITISGFRYTVSGIADEEKRLAVEVDFNSLPSSSTLSYMTVHSILASTMKTRPPGYVSSEMLSRVEVFLRDVGQDEVKLTDLSIDENGSIQGLSPTLERYFAGVDLGADMNVWKGPDDPVQYKLELQKRDYKWFLTSAIKEMQHIGYENLPRIALDFTMKGGTLQYTYGNVK